jgi:hypothetical protein
LIYVKNRLSGAHVGRPAAVEFRRAKNALAVRKISWLPPAGLLHSRFRRHNARSREGRWPVVWSSGEGYGVRFAYVEPPNAPAAVIEISELTEATAANAIFIHDAAAEWDGTNRFRHLLGA